MQEEALAPAAGGGGGGVASVRPLCPGDEPAVRLLCADSFPIVYPDNWYAYITSDRVSGCAIDIHVCSGSSEPLMLPAVLCVCVCTSLYQTFPLDTESDRIHAAHRERGWGEWHAHTVEPL